MERSRARRLYRLLVAAQLSAHSKRWRRPLCHPTAADPGKQHSFGSLFGNQPGLVLSVGRLCTGAMSEHTARGRALCPVARSIGTLLAEVNSDVPRTSSLSSVRPKLPWVTLALPIKFYYFNSHLTSGWGHVRMHSLQPLYHPPGGFESSFVGLDEEIGTLVVAEMIADAVCTQPGWNRIWTESCSFVARKRPDPALTSAQRMSRLDTVRLEKSSIYMCIYISSFLSSYQVRLRLIDIDSMATINGELQKSEACPHWDGR